MKRMLMLAAIAVLLVNTAQAQNEAKQAGDWIVRGGVGGVLPKSNNLSIAGIGTVEVDDGYAITINATYMVTDAIGIELLAATPFKHDISVAGAGKIGSTYQLPPTLSVQWHTPTLGPIQPYVGLGINWTVFFNEETTELLDSVIGDPTTLNLDSSLGLAGQVGADWNLNDNWLLNLDVRYISIETDAQVNGTELGEVDITPWVVSLNVGYKF